MGQFRPGQSGNPTGRPKGSSGGRAQALASLDVIMGKNRNKRKLEKALEAEFDRDPIRFFRTILMPLMPRESRLSLEPNGVVQWRSLVDDSDVSGGVDAVDRIDGGDMKPRLLEG